MTEERLEQEVDEIKQMLLAQQAQSKTPSLDDTVSRSSKYIRWLQGIIALIVIVVGMGITWGLTQGKINQLELDIATVQRTQAVEVLKCEEDRQNLRSDLMAVQIKQAAVDQLLTAIRDDIAEIKINVKELTNRRGGK